MKNFSAEILDRHGYENTLIHKIDPRAKIVACLVFIILVISFEKHEIAGLTPYFLFPVIIAILGFVPLGILFKQVVLSLPLVALIGIFNPILDKSYGVQILGLEISKGWLSFFSILLKGTLAVSAAVVMISTTSFSGIIQGLQKLKVPQALTTQLILLYRYLFVLIHQAHILNQSRSLRSAGKKLSIKLAGSMLSVLLTRTIERSERIYHAMVLRGFDGSLKSSYQLKWRVSDSLYLIFVIGFSILFRFFPVAKIIGKISIDLWQKL